MTWRRPIRKSLNRPNLFLGCERQPILFSIFCSSVIFLFGQSKYTSLVAVAFFIFSLWGLRKMANKDPHLFEVYRRHIKQNPFYFGRARPFRKT